LKRNRKIKETLRKKNRNTKEVSRNKTRHLRRQAWPCVFARKGTNKNGTKGKTLNVAQHKKNGGGRTSQNVVSWAQPRWRPSR